MAIKFWFHPTSGNFASELRLKGDAVKKADSLGFDGFVLPDHYMTPLGNETLDSWVTLAHFAAMTDRIRLGTLVTPIPLRPPQLLAKMVSTVDVLSGGRSFLGVGAGWSKEEFGAFSQWDESRVRVEKVDEGVALIKKLWTGLAVDFEGKHYRVKQAILLPKPVQKPHPPLLFGGKGPRMLKLAGKQADICFIAQEKPEDFLAAKAVVMEASKAAGRFGVPTFACFIGLQATDEKGDYVRRIEQAADLGVSYIATGVERERDSIEFLVYLARDVMPSFA